MFFFLYAFQNFKSSLSYVELFVIFHMLFKKTESSNPRFILDRSLDPTRSCLCSIMVVTYFSLLFFLCHCFFYQIYPRIYADASSC